MNYWPIFLIILLLTACQKKAEENKLFSLLPSSITNINFENKLTYTEAFNTYTYRNFYNGGGVGIGDLNNDGFSDIFFCGNMVSNKLYMNSGKDLIFQDVTTKSGLETSDVWSTGVSIVDINADGWLDIYVCKAGKPEGKNRRNALYINDAKGIGKTPTFTEQAKKYGLDHLGMSTHAAFFDYDKDGDLDMYLLNNSIRPVGVFDIVKNQRNISDQNGANKLYQNNAIPPTGGMKVRFTDISAKAGIYTSAIGFGLGVTIGDINKDGWQDIYVSNDFFEKDYLYINQKNGSFSEEIEKNMSEISLGSMGADMADINNDALPDVFVTEMLPESNERIKTKTAFENWAKYQNNIKEGYHKQFSRNVLQLNRGENAGFSEISRLAGVHATDWSWGALLADFDNDSYKDIYVANGIFKDLTDLDYISYYADPSTIRKLLTQKGKFLKELIDKIPSTPLPNFAFKNSGKEGIEFENKTADWGLEIPSFSNGSAYGDLDNDGDLDLVVNNVNMPSFIFRNNAENDRLKNKFLSIELKAKGMNTNALGSQITVFANGKTLYQELAPMRGYQSTVDNRLHFGLGNISTIDSVQILWPDLSLQTIKNCKINQHLKIEKLEGNLNPKWAKKQFENEPIFTDITSKLKLNYVHNSSQFSDFDRDPLLFNMVKNASPQTAVGDLNIDKLDDFYVTGGFGNRGKLYFQNTNGSFIESKQSDLEKYGSKYESAVLFFDANGDGFQDIYLASGGNEFVENSPELEDKLFLNNGKGQFMIAKSSLHFTINQNTSCVRANDFDQDGDQDLFVCIRAKAYFYGQSTGGYLLENTGNDKNGQPIFKNNTNKIAPEIKNIGMITDAQWLDFDQDKDADLLLSGDWMGLKLFENKSGIFKDISDKIGLENTNGFWNCIAVADLNQDGFLDFVAGNLGQNTRLNASTKKPLEMLVNDFDNNGKNEQIITSFYKEKSYPLATMKDLVAELPILRKKLPNYNAYSSSTIQELFEPALIKNAKHFAVTTTKSMVFINKKGKFIGQNLPIESQITTMNSILIDDFDGDGKKDIFWGGNNTFAKPEMGINEAGIGQLLKNNGNGNFSPINSSQSGIKINGEIRNINKINIKGKPNWLIAKTNGAITVLTKK